MTDEKEKEIRKIYIHIDDVGLKVEEEINTTKTMQWLKTITCRRQLNDQSRST